MATKMATDDDDLQPDEVRAALMHLVEVAACYERRHPEVEDDAALRLLRETVRLAEQHRRRRATPEGRARILDLAADLANLYVRVESGDLATAADLQKEVSRLFDEAELPPKEAGLDELVLTADEIRENGGPKDAAMKALGEVLRPATRTLYNWQKADPPPLAATAFGLRIGKQGLESYLDALRARLGDMGTTDKPFVFFDTNVLEERLLAPLMRGETCRDFQHVASYGYVPALHVKSWLEICHHAKTGSKPFPWLTNEFGYPGGLETGKQILRELDDDDFDLEANALWYFGLCEEWRGKDWDEERARTLALVRPEEADDAVKHVEVRRRFAEWKFSLSSFCERIWTVLRKAATIVSDHEIYRLDTADRNTAAELQQEIALESLVPNEDTEIVVGALLTGAAALVTSDKRLLNLSGLSLSLNHHTSFVHPDQLAEAVKDGFPSRWIDSRRA